MKAIRLTLGIVCLAIAALAQDVTGTINGTVTDPTGALVPDAKVTIRNSDKNTVERTVTTDAQGNYSAPLLAVGHYTVTVEKPGFKAATRTDVVLNVNQKITLNLTMELGNETESVTVQESPVQVELTSPAANNVVSGVQVRELSLNNRNYEQLVALAPGVSSGASDQLYIGTSNPLGGTNVVSFSINGNRNSANNWTADGADNVDRGANLTLLNYPSVDSIAEFNVMRGQYLPELGRSASGQINVITKSGTRDFHGDAYEFVRNDAFSANYFFNNANGRPTPPLRYNNFGYTVGGPLFIPGIYNKDRNKTFFFWSQEFRRVITYGTPQATLPTPAEIQGQFTHPVCVAATGNTCTHTAAAIANINPVAASYIKDIFGKLPAAGANNLLFSPQRNIFNHRQELIKIDHVFSERLTVSGRYMHDSIPTEEPGGIFTGSALPGVATTSTNSPGQSVVARATATISPTWMNELGYAYSYGAILSNPIGLLAPGASPDINMPLPFANTLDRVPSLSFGGVISGVSTFGPYRDYNRNHNVFDNMTKVLGRHTFKFGTSINFYQKTENSGGTNVPSFTFATTPRPARASALEQA